MARSHSGTAAENRAERAFVVTVLVSAVVLGFAYYLQHVKYLDPCPWCVVQRIGFLAIGVLALIGLLHRPGRGGVILYGLLGGLLASAGGLAAGYQIWLQSDPARAGACVGSPLERLLDRLAIGDLWPDFLQYDGPCTLKPWDLFGLTIPEWSLAWFVVLAAMFLSLLLRSRD